MAKWTEEDLVVLREPITAREAARKLGRSLRSVARARQYNKIRVIPPGNPRVSVPEPTTVTDDRQKLDESHWQREYRALSKKYDVLLKADGVVERLVQHISSLAPREYSPMPSVPPRRKSQGHPQSAVLMFSDTHIGKNTKPGQTLNFGEYSFAMFMARLKYLEEAVISIRTEHVTTPVPELVIAMLGDMLDGTLAHSNEVGQLDPIFNQYYMGAHVIAQFFRNLAPYFPKLRIYDTPGNHTRFQQQHRMPTKNKYSNFDKFLYALIRQLVRDIPNIEWTLNAQPYQTFEVQGHTFFTAHGETLRGGDKTLGIPNHAVGRLISAFTQMANKYGQKAPNYYLVGHLHRDIVLPHATGSFIVNGGFPGVDEFGLAEMFTPSDPTQKLFYVNSRHGRTASYDISLKLAEVTEVSPYTLPEGFEMH